MIPNAQKHFLEHEILSWALKAYSDKLHPLSPLASHTSVKKENFKWLVTVVGIYIIPVYLKERMKFENDKDIDLSMICDDPKVRNNPDFIDLVEATFHEGTSPVQRVLVKHLITPLIDSLIIEPTLNIEHPLFKDLKNLPAVYYNYERQTTIAQIIKESTGVEHKGNYNHQLYKASNIIAYYVKQSRVSEVADIPSDYSPLLSKQHQENIAEYMTLEVSREIERLKRSQQGKMSSFSTLTKLLMGILEDDPSISHKDAMKKITAYAKNSEKECDEDPNSFLRVFDDGGEEMIEYKTKEGKLKALKTSSLPNKLSILRKKISK